jgi:hypothetical protein
MKFLLTNISFYAITFCAIAFSVAINTNLFIFTYPTSITLIKSPGNATADNETTYLTENYTYFFNVYDDFLFTHANHVIQLAEVLFRDVFIAVLLLFFNVLILLRIRQMTSTRVYLEQGGHVDRTSPQIARTPSAVDTSVRQAVKAERRKAKMIIFTGLNYVLGHVVWVFIAVVRLFYPDLLLLSSGSGWLCFQFFSSCLGCLLSRLRSFSTTFLISDSKNSLIPL